jgi:uncharacterized membrane protein HdeD (DUF308 family)
MKHIKEYLILFQLGICLLIGGIASVFSFDRDTSVTILIMGSTSLIAGVVILWKGFIVKIIKDRQNEKKHNTY